MELSETKLAPRVTMSKKPTYEELVQRVRESSKADPVCKQPEEALRHHKELLQLFVKHTPAAVAMCDLQDAIPVL